MKPEMIYEGYEVTKMMFLLFGGCFSASVAAFVIIGFLGEASEEEGGEG